MRLGRAYIHQTLPCRPERCSLHSQSRTEPVWSRMYTVAKRTQIIKSIIRLPNQSDTNTEHINTHNTLQNNNVGISTLNESRPCAGHGRSNSQNYFKEQKSKPKSLGDGHAGTSSCGLEDDTPPSDAPRERVRSSRSHEEKENPSEPHLTKVSSQTTPHPTHRHNPYHRGTQWPISNLGREDGLEKQVLRYKSRQRANLTWREWFRCYVSEFWVVCHDF